MWTPETTPPEFPWDRIQALYPAAYAALFDTAPNVALFTQGVAPYQLSVFNSQAAREAGDAVDYMRDFRLRDLYEFFDAHGLCILVHPGHDADLPARREWNLALLHPNGLPITGRKQMGATTRGQAELFAFVQAFALLEAQLMIVGTDAENYVEPGPGTPAL